ncbi:MAG: hypothetical protein LBC51_02035, partial [Treponema sp.]|nr:hypothetical protein [Treponema sp.]
FHGLEKHFQKMDNAGTGLGDSPQSIRNHLWGGQSPPMICCLHKNNYKFEAHTALLCAVCFAFITLIHP